MDDQFQVYAIPCRIGYSPSTRLTPSLLSAIMHSAAHLLTFLIRILQQVIPVEDVKDESVSVGVKSALADAKRPAFSLPVMGNNFRRFNAR
jgi:hypothetical protein